MEETNEVSLETLQHINLDENEDNDNIEENIVFQRKKRSKTASCWKEMEEWTNDQGCKMTKCFYCKNSWALDKYNTTTTLNRHLKNCLQRQSALGRNSTLKQQVLSFTQTESDGVSSINNFTYDHAIVRKLAAQMILVHEYPFLMMEHVLFNKLMKVVSPFYQKISRHCVKQDCMSVYDEEKKKLKTLLHKVDKINITTDLWKSGQSIQYMAVTGHFVDSNQVLQKRVLSFKNVPPPHTGVVVADILSKYFLDWGIENKLASITVDNASYNDVCIRRLKDDLLLRKKLPIAGKLFHVRCCAHILNLLVQDGLGEIESIVDVVLEGVKYLKNSEAQINEFAKILKQLQLSCKKLLLDCPTRWNETYLMLAAALEVKDVFSRYHDIDLDFCYVPNSHDWMKVEEVTQFLAIFHEITNTIFGSEYPTSNLFLPE